MMDLHDPQPIAPLSYWAGTEDRSLPLGLSPAILDSHEGLQERDWRAERLVERAFDVLATDTERCLDAMTLAACSGLAEQMNDLANSSDGEVAAVEAFLADLGIEVGALEPIAESVKEKDWFPAAQTALDALLEYLVAHRSTRVEPEVWAKECSAQTDLDEFSFFSGLDASGGDLALEITARCTASWLGENGRQELMYRNRFVQLSAADVGVQVDSFVPGVLVVDADAVSDGVGDSGTPSIAAIPVGPDVEVELDVSLATFRLNGCPSGEGAFLRFEMSSGPSLCGRSCIALGEFGPPSTKGVVPWVTSAGTLWQWQVPDEERVDPVPIVSTRSDDPTFDVNDVLRFVSLQPQYGDPPM